MGVSVILNEVIAVFQVQCLAFSSNGQYIHTQSVPSRTSQLYKMLCAVLSIAISRLSCNCAAIPRLSETSTVSTCGRGLDFATENLLVEIIFDDRIKAVDLEFLILVETVKVSFSCWQASKRSQTSIGCAK